LHELVLILHSYTRWWVLAAGVLTLLGSAWAAAARKAWSRRDERLARAFVAGVDLQVLLGLTLYFGLSPLARFARALWSAGGLGALSRAFEAAFFGVLHPALMLLGAVILHAGWIATRRAEPPARRRRLVLSVALALLTMAVAVPWPFLGHDRPWFRF
jgi:hypothetical protein